LGEIDYENEKILLQISLTDRWLLTLLGESLLQTILQRCKLKKNWFEAGLGSVVIEGTDSST
jgi:hypothetical protein